jgi:hypothetical protein
MASLPAAALLYRQGHVRESHTTYVFAPTKEMLFDRSISPANSVALRTASERGKLEIAMPKVSELPWLDQSVIPPAATVIHDHGHSLIPVNASEIISDTGELTRNWHQQTYTINTPRTQAAMGKIGGNTISLAEVELRVVAKNAVVAVQSLDENPISRSQSIMISAGAGARSTPSPGDSSPYLSERVEGDILVRAPAGLRLHAWDASAGRLRPMPMSFKEKRYRIALDGNLTSSWLLLSSKPPVPSSASQN